MAAKNEKNGQKNHLIKMIISPAKTLDFEKPLPDFINTALVDQTGTQKLIFPEKSNTIAKTLKNCTKPSLKKIFNVSENIASLNYQRYKNFKLDETENSRPAIFSFNGPAFKAIDPFNQNFEFVESLNEKLFILCGLYGVIKPMDLIQEYRLEMSNKFEILTNVEKNSKSNSNCSQTSNFSNLYDFWSDHLTNFIIDQFQGHLPENSSSSSSSSCLLVNVASNEYSKAINFKTLTTKNINIVNCKFLTDNRQAAVYSKQARGLMAKYVVENEEDIEKQGLSGLEKFDLDGYKIYKKSSEKKFENGQIELVFKRAKPKQGTKRKR